MATNKVEYFGKVLIDLTEDSVTPETLAEGVTAHDKSGAVIVGTMTSGGGGGGDSDLPSGCKRVEYIEFSGGQFIDLGIKGNQDTAIRASFTWGGATQNHLFGCASPNNTASITSYMNGSWRFGDKYATKTIQKNNTDLPYAVRLDKTVIGVTGSRTAISGVEDFETIGTMLLGGARNSNGALPVSGLVGKVFYFNLWQGDEQILKLIPVVDADGNYHFWDAIGKKFFDSMTSVPLDGGDL